MNEQGDSNPNPYQAPTSDVAQVHTDTEYHLVEPRMNSFVKGWDWLAEGFRMFGKSPGGWLLTALLLLVIIIGLSLIPLLGQIALMLSFFIFTGGVMIGCRAQDQGQAFEVNHLFAGFSNHAVKLLLLSLIYNAIGIGIMIIAVGPIYWGMMTGDPEAAQALASDPLQIILSVLIGLLFIIPLMMAVWFAPVLIVQHDLGIMQSMKMSFIGCLKNFLPFLLYGIVGLVFYILALIPLGLGMLVFIPVIFASMFASYKDIYLAKPGETAI